jgi:hypothetical protein
MFDYYPDRLRDPNLHKKWTGPLPPPEGSTSEMKFDRQRQIFFIVRMLFPRSSSEKADNLMRVSTGNVRLVAQQKDESGTLQPHDYYPWGTVEGGNVLIMDKPDDFLIVDMAESDSRAVDFLFVVDKDGFLTPDSKGATLKIADGVFVEFKRMAREDFSGKVVAATPAPLNGVALGVMHPPVQPGLPQPPGAVQPGTAQPVAAAPPRTAAPTAQPPTTTAAKAPVNNAARGSLTSAQQNVAAIGGKIFNYQSISKSNLLATAVAVPQADIDKALIQVQANGVDIAHLSNKRFDKLSIDAKVSTTQLGTGDFKTRELAVPDGQFLLQINSALPSDPWVWAQKAGAFKLRTSDNKQVSPNGIWAIIHEGNEDRLVARYFTDDPLSPDTLIPVTQGQPTQITLAFLLPNGVTPKELTLDDQIVKEVSTEPIR